MQLAKTPQHDFVERRVVFEVQRRILRHDGVQRVRRPLRVLVARWFDREAVHRTGQLYRLQVVVVFVV